ncbi:hypothetical protein HYPSUDRAFT_210353 [Hypholoma sublateritium FD-334 SS-4]|uniref:Uncharacterized protein n=1 Tax=Hypholoma sublateritium (strain FD-334 SS-4) TaxID=945553 RepID=A0A0D2N700_HYPSF|nr:hypothetical protein HYPSUDRAFT_210353 [Hypholoma sublateritium FD-334 SS-4]
MILSVPAISLITALRSALLAPSPRSGVLGGTAPFLSIWWADTAEEFGGVVGGMVFAPGCTARVFTRALRQRGQSLLLRDDGARAISRRRSARPLPLVR